MRHWRVLETRSVALDRIATRDEREALQRRHGILFVVHGCVEGARRVD